MFAIYIGELLLSSNDIYDTIQIRLIMHYELLIGESYAV